MAQLFSYIFFKKSNMKGTISNLRYISKFKFPTCPLIFNFEKLDYSWIYSKSSFNFCTTKLFKEGTYGNNKVWGNPMTLFDPCSVWAIKLVKTNPFVFTIFMAVLAERAFNNVLSHVFKVFWWLYIQYRRIVESPTKTHYVNNLSTEPAHPTF